MKKLPFLLVFSILFLMGCQKEEVSLTTFDDNLEFRNGNGKAVERAFRGHLISPPPSPGNICMLEPGDFGREISEEGSGQLTHLGNITGGYTGCGRPFFPGIPASIPGRFILDISLTGAHGDMLYIHTEFNSFPNENEPDLSVFAGTFSITGGTGRFEEASGGGDMTGVGAANPANPDINPRLDFDGTITY